MYNNKQGFNNIFMENISVKYSSQLVIIKWGECNPVTSGHNLASHYFHVQNFSIAKYKMNKDQVSVIKLDLVGCSL